MLFRTYSGDDGPGEEECTTEVPVTVIMGCVSNGTHSGADRIHRML